LSLLPSTVALLSFLCQCFDSLCFQHVTYLSAHLFAATLIYPIRHCPCVLRLHSCQPFFTFTFTSFHFHTTNFELFQCAQERAPFVHRQQHHIGPALPQEQPLRPGLFAQELKSFSRRNRVTYLLFFNILPMPDGLDSRSEAP
jgi:hypothetical protein